MIYVSRIIAKTCITTSIKQMIFKSIDHEFFKTKTRRHILLKKWISIFMKLITTPIIISLAMVCPTHLLTSYSRLLFLQPNLLEKSCVQKLNQTSILIMTSFSPTCPFLPAKRQSLSNHRLHLELKTTGTKSSGLKMV